MPIKIRVQLVDLDWGSTIYVINDPEQLPNSLVGVQVIPGGALLYLLKGFYDIDPIPYYDFECTTEPGEKRPIPPSKIDDLEDED